VVDEGGHSPHSQRMTADDVNARRRFLEELRRAPMIELERVSRDFTTPENARVYRALDGISLVVPTAASSHRRPQRMRK